MYKYLFVPLALLLSNACSENSIGLVSEKHMLAEQFFRGIYGCDPSVVDELASDDITISYEIFEKLFDSPSIKGRKAVRDFANGFCSRWTDAKFTFHESVTEGNRVVLVWSFSARMVGSALENVSPTNQVNSWGGISLFLFNDAGKIMLEVGEESEPGPAERLAVNDVVL